MVRGSHCQNHDIMAAVAGIGVARDRAGEPQPHIALPRLQSSRHHHNDNKFIPRPAQSDICELRPGMAT